MKYLVRLLGALTVLVLASYAMHEVVWVPYRCNIAKREMPAATEAADALLNPVHKAAKARDNLERMAYCSRKCPSDLELRMMIAANWRMLQRPDMAVAEYRTALRWDDRPEILVALGMAEAATGDSKAASASFTKAVLFDPKYYGSIGDPDLRRDVRTGIARRYPKFVLTEYTHQELFRGGVEAEKNGDLESAAQAFRDAIAIDPTLSEYHLRLATVLAAQQKHELAAETLARALKTAERDWVDDLSVLLGDQYSALNRTADAVAAYERAVAAEPQESFARIRLGGAYRALGRFDEARRTFHVVADTGPASQRAAALCELALTEEKAGNLPAAIEQARRASELAPSVPGYTAELNRLLARNR